MSKDKSEINTRAGWFVQSVRVDCNEPIGLQCKAECLADFILDSYIWVDGEKWLFMEDYIILWLPGMLVSVKEIESSLRAASHSGADIWIYSAEFPEPVYQCSGPEYLVMASAFHSVSECCA